LIVDIKFGLFFMFPFGNKTRGKYSPDFYFSIFKNNYGIKEISLVHKLMYVSLFVTMTKF
jgi:hypothetical protein